jgi:two-component system chemotaxis response regulator CheB
MNERRKVAIDRRRNADSIQMLGIVASTGGPNALERLLNTLPIDFPVPIALVQHITASFQDAFVSWLRDVCPLPVVEATAGLKPLRGVVYVAPANRHLYVARECFRLGDGEPEHIHRPSGTILLESIAKSFDARSLGVLLTGMGDDGAEGLRAIHDAGGYTIAEDESTAVVYGMPAVAVRLGAVSESLPLGEIGPRIVELVAN